jgi:drug/metabolite transporter (DMT)-like permease
LTGQVIGAERRGTTLLVLASALMWGVWWVPVRLCESMGLTGVWPNLGINTGALLIAAGLVLYRPKPPPLSRRALLGSALIGIAVALYGASLSLTDVARAVLLFYLAPAWSTAIEVTFLGQRRTWRQLPPLVLSLMGMIVVMRGEISLESGGIGDLAALTSGLAWSAGAALVFSAEPQDTPRLSLTVMFAGVAMSLILLAADWQGPPDLGSTHVVLALLVALAAGGVYLAPIIVVTLWGANQLPPTTMSFLLTAEILSGVTSSAIFLDERFGWPELLGTVLIVASVIVHIALSGKGQSPA